MSVIKTVKSSTGVVADIEIFESSIELVETCKNRKIMSGEFDDVSKRIYGDFENCKDYEDALNLLNFGWDKHIPNIKKLVSDCGKTIYEKRITTEQSVEGFVPIVPLALNRVPNAMLNARYKPVKTKTISLYYDVVCPSYYNKDNFFENGKKLVNAIVKLERSGYRVSLNIIGSFTAEWNEGKFMAVNVKPANQLMDIKRLCFPLMHNAMSRVFAFDWYSKFPKTKYYGGYGHNAYSRYGKEKTQQLFRDLFGKESVFLSIREMNDIEDAEKYILEKLEAR